ncbi:MAG: hypothetical protein OXG52_12100 [bacterium]|nr:hypothetical protein [bacterium]
MAELLFSPESDRQLTVLAADTGRTWLYERVNDALDAIEDDPDPGDARLRRRRYHYPPLWGIVVPAEAVDWLILWSETDLGPIVHYIGKDLA